MYRYGSALRARIGKYTSQHGPTAGAKYFSRTLKDHTVSKSIVHSIMKSYLDEIKRRRRLDGSGEIECLRERKRGRPLLLGGVIDSKVEAYVKKVREGGGTISARVVMAAARGILLSCEKQATNTSYLIVNGFVRSGICDALDGGDGNADEVQNLAHESSEESSTDESSDSA